MTWQGWMRAFRLLIIALVLTGCSRNTERMFGKRSVKKAGITSHIVKKEDYSIVLPSSTNGNVTVTYLGSGGCYIGNETSAILIDPFFSHQPFLSLPFKKIKSSKQNISFGLAGVESELTKVKGVFVSHSHYDHLMDVPYVYNHYLDSSDVNLKVYGSTSMKTILGTVIDSDRLITIDSAQGSVDNKGAWNYLSNSNIRVLAIKTAHAPHYKKVIPISLYKGEAEELKGFDSDTAKTRPHQWRGGKTFAFMVDFIREDSVFFRVYIQSSSAAPPNGFVHQEVLDEHQIDLAILGTASFSNVKDYPNGIVHHLQPEKIMLCHWEDFFLPYDRYPKRLVRATNIRKFLLKLNGIYPWKEGEEEQFFMPAPGVSIDFKY